MKLCFYVSILKHNDLQLGIIVTVKAKLELCPPTGDAYEHSSARYCTDTWIPATWEDYQRLTEDPAYAKAKGYYYRNHMRLEILPVGFDYGTDHSVIALAINLFCILKNIALTMPDSCSYRKIGVRDSQPDLSCYVGNRARVIPVGTNIVNLDQYPAPDLAIEISKMTQFQT